MGMCAIGTDPIGICPREMDPVGTDPIGMGPIEMDPAEMRPRETETLGTASIGTDPVRMHPTGTDPIGTDPIGLDPLARAFAAGAVTSGMRGGGLGTCGLTRGPCGRREGVCGGIGDSWHCRLTAAAGSEPREPSPAAVKQDAEARTGWSSPPRTYTEALIGCHPAVPSPPHPALGPISPSSLPEPQIQVDFTPRHPQTSRMLWHPPAAHCLGLGGNRKPSDLRGRHHLLVSQTSPNKQYFTSFKAV